MLTKIAAVAMLLCAIGLTGCQTANDEAEEGKDSAVRREVEVMTTDTETTVGTTIVDRGN